MGKTFRTEQEKEFLNLLRNSKDRAAAVQRFCTFHQIPFVATDRSVLNLPGIGKSMTFVTIGMTKEGKRILEFDHDPTASIVRLFIRWKNIHQGKQVYLAIYAAIVGNGREERRICQSVEIYGRRNRTPLSLI